MHACKCERSCVLHAHACLHTHVTSVSVREIGGRERGRGSTKGTMREKDVRGKRGTSREERGREERGREREGGRERGEREGGRERGG